MRSSTARSLDVTGISKSFDGTEVLADVSLAVEPGEVVALLGPSGCGKTTLLRTMAGLERPDTGEVRIGDEVMAGPGTWVNPESRNIGLVFQDWALFPHLTVAKNVAYGLSRSERSSSRAADVLDLVGLAEYADRMPPTLSGGQQQRVALARALAPQPSVLLLDEPFSNLDTALRVEVRTEVYRLLLDVGITALFVTHDQEEAFVLGDRVAVMHDGRIEQVDTPNGLYTHPSTRWIASFVGNVNFVDGAATGEATATTVLGAVPLGEPATGPLDVLLRPEDLMIGDGDDGRVELVEYYGHDAMVLIGLPGEQSVQVRTPPDVTYRRGDRVGVTYRGGPTTAFPAN